MTRLRPRLARDAEVYPERPIVYRRPFLRLFAAAFLAFTAWLDLELTFSEVEDGFRRDDWLLALAFVPTLGLFYLFTTSRLVVDATHVVISNPLRQVKIPLAHVVDVVPGSNLKIVTRYKKFWAWGVEAANAQVVARNFGSQATLQSLILDAARKTEVRDAGEARYRFRPPDLVFTAYVSIAVVCAAALRLGYGANG